MPLRLACILITLLLSLPSFAGTYHLDIARKQVTITGKPVSKITINGTLPGPILRFKEGEDVTIHVTNHMDEDTSIHWHGFILPGAMDGVPGLNGFPGIKPGETFTYHFNIRQSGTYWYHAHSGAQEQDGHYGAIIVTPKAKDPIQSDRDYVVLLSDFTHERAEDILPHLKMDASYYNYAQRTIGDFFHDVKTMGLKAAWENTKMWGEMRMSPTDLSDVSGYNFLVNGHPAERRWTGLFKPSEKIRLRFINASAMSIYDVRIPGLKMLVVAADGQNVEPVPVDEFRFGIAETYDVIVEPAHDKAYTIIAEPIDRTGFALGTLAPHEGMVGETPKHRPRAQLTMMDMGMGHMHHHPSPSGRGESEAPGEGKTMQKTSPHPNPLPLAGEGASGWADAGTPTGHKMLDYSDLRNLGIQADTHKPERDISVMLDGNMERYIWTIDGKTYDGKSPITLTYGEHVRLTFINKTMMAHPMHLHGMFVQLENGQPRKKLPNKHTIIIPPGQSYSALLTANQPGEWALHCHLLYHMLSGMMTTVTVAKLEGGTHAD